MEKLQVEQKPVSEEEILRVKLAENRMIRVLFVGNSALTAADVEKLIRHLSLIGPGLEPGVLDAT